MARQLFIAAALSALTAPALATTIGVTTSFDQFGTDLGNCSLREAIQAASTDSPFGGCPAGTSLDTIVFANIQNAFMITREGANEDANATGDFDFSGTGTIVIQGNGAAKTIIDANGLDRVFDIAAGSSVQLLVFDLTLKRGDPGNSDGGGIRGRSGRLVLRDTHITENSARNGGGIYVPANATDVEIIRSSITRNRASGLGGGIYSGGPLELVNVTLSENVAGSLGGGIRADAATTLKNVTVAFNTAQSVGGASLEGGLIAIDNSIFANNSHFDDFSQAADLNCFTAAVSHGHNMFMDRNCPFTVLQASDVTADPLLATLVDAGNGVPVNLLMPDSPAIDTGAPAPNDGSFNRCAAVDQRNFTRQQCDRGAYEQRFTYSVNNTADAPDTNVGNGVCLSTLGGCTLRAALQEASVSPEPVIINLPEGIYSVNLPGRDENLAASGDLDILAPDNDARILIGRGPDRTIIQSNGSDRVFDTVSTLQSAPIGLFGLRIRGGHALASGADNGAGGGIRLRPRGESTLDQVWVDGNRSAANGGGLYSIDGSFLGATVRITRSAFTRNESGLDGGGAYLAQGRPITVSNTLFADNRTAVNGGGLHMSNTTAGELSFITLTNNWAGGRGGGIVPDGSVVLGAILSAGNRDGGGESSRPDCYVPNTPALSSGYNIIGDAGTVGCPMAGDLTGNLVGVAAPLAVAAVLEGGMPSSAAQPGNPAIDAIPRFSCMHVDGRLEINDQIRRPRPGSDPARRCTSGAIEGPSDLIFAHGIDASYAGE